MASKLPAAGDFAVAYREPAPEMLPEWRAHCAGVFASLRGQHHSHLVDFFEEAIAKDKSGAAEQSGSANQDGDTVRPLSDKERHDQLTVSFILQQYQLAPKSLRFPKFDVVPKTALPAWAASMGIFDCACERQFPVVFVAVLRGSARTFEFCRLCAYTQIVEVRFAFARHGNGGDPETFELPDEHARVHLMKTGCSRASCSRCGLKFLPEDQFYQIEDFCGAESERLCFDCVETEALQPNANVKASRKS